MRLTVIVMVNMDGSGKLCLLVVSSRYCGVSKTWKHCHANV